VVNERFELAGYPKNGRVDHYQQELLNIEKTNDMNKMLAFANKLFADCNEYLKSTFNFCIPTVHLYLVNHKVFSQEADKWDVILGPIPRHRALTLFSPVLPPKIYIDFESHIVGHQPAESVVSLCIDFMEELIHSSDPTKGEMQIHESLCSAIEEFLEIKLPEGLKQYRTEYSKICDEKNPPSFRKTDLKT
jgi:hypothetical protein